MQTNKEKIILLGEDGRIRIDYESITFEIPNLIWEDELSIPFSKLKQVKYKDYKVYPFLIILSLVIAYFFDTSNTSVDDPRKIIFKYYNEEDELETFKLIHGELSRKKQNKLVRALMQRSKNTKFTNLG